jgi:NAD(P)H-hydrate epimerase
MISIAEMKALEDKAEANGVSRLTLMENAGRQIFEALGKKFNLKKQRVLVVCYHGNNGGDGFVTARLLAEEAETDVLFIGDESKFKEEASESYKKIEDNPMVQFVGISFVNFDEYDIIIDAMLGTGIEGELKYPINTVVDFINKSKAFKLSVDVPTGMNPDTGEVPDKTVNADLIVTFHDIKKGLEKVKNKVEVVDIGIPK